MHSYFWIWGKNI